MMSIYIVTMIVVVVVVVVVIVDLDTVGIGLITFHTIRGTLIGDNRCCSCHLCLEYHHCSTRR